MNQAVLAEQQLGASPTRHALLVALLRDGPLTPEDLAHRQRLSRTAVLHQLRILAAAGLVSRQAMRHGVGRPRHLYDVTPRAQGLVQADYTGLARSLIAAVQTVGGPALLDDVFLAIRAAQGERIRARMAGRRINGSSLHERVRELAAFQDSQGFVCEVPDGEVLRLRQNNCPYFRVVAGAPLACESELALLRDVLSAEVTRETHITDGDRCCTYRIEEIAPAAKGRGAGAR